MKKNLFIMFAVLCSLALAGCGGSSSGGDGTPQDPLDLGSDFDAKYYPKKEDNRVAELVKGASSKMKIDVALNYEGTVEGWKALADEYERLCGNIVDVNIVAELDTASYIEKLRVEESNPKTDWDIVQGNLLNQAESHCENLRQTIKKENPYAGNRYWDSFIEEKAYITDLSGSSSTTYLLNTENLSTAWFINTAATTKAGISDTTPETWEELIDILEALQQAGYKYPLGLSLNKDGISNSQFAWLLRIYGDYYYRQNYKYTSKTYDLDTDTDAKFTYDKTASNQEASSEFTFSWNRALCLMLDESGDFYSGANSDLYKDFLTQFQKLAKYVKPSAYQQSFNEVRTSFMAQRDGNNGDEAPQIVLDYAGSGLQFLTADTLKDNIDFFDYPTIESDYVEKGTLTRDVGGNGGYLAILNYHNRRQTDLNKDFLQFVLTPYGQTIYYQALRKNNVSPKGLTTVYNDLVVIPDEWVEFFQTDKIKFSGLADNNNFNDIGLVKFLSNTKSSDTYVSLWQKLLTTVNPITVDKFAADWHYSMLSNWPTVYAEHGWKEDVYYWSHFEDAEYIGK